MKFNGVIYFLVRHSQLHMLIFAREISLFTLRIKFGRYLSSSVMYFVYFANLIIT